MRARIIKIGNSQGVRIPKALLERTRLAGEVELEAAGASIIISPAVRPRQGWEEAFREMAAKGDDRLDADFTDLRNEWDATEWEW